MTTPLLEIENATKIYSGARGKQVVALQNFNLTIPQKPAKIVTIAGDILERVPGKTDLVDDLRVTLGGAERGYRVNLVEDALFREPGVDLNGVLEALAQSGVQIILRILQYLFCVVVDGAVALGDIPGYFPVVRPGQ